MHAIAEYEDYLIEVDRLIEACTCDWCGDVAEKPIKKEWLCRKTKKDTVKHYKYWRVCAKCLFTVNVSRMYSKMVFDLTDILSVQPMSVPSGQLFYMDFVHTAREPIERVVRQAMPGVDARVTRIDGQNGEIQVDVESIPPKTAEYITIDYTIP
jgi:hypothetical protein